MATKTGGLHETAGGILCCFLRQFPALDPPIQDKGDHQGNTVGFLVYQIGTLITTGSLGAAFVPGLIAVLAFAAVITYLCVRSNRSLSRDYALNGVKA